MRLATGTEPFGWLIVAKPVTALREQLLTLLGRLALALAAGLALAGVLFWWLSRRLTEPVLALTRATEHVAAGRYDVEIPAGRGSDEISLLTDRFRGMVEKLSETERLKRSFLMSVTHELRTPLTAIRGHVEALREGVVSEPEQVAGSLEIIAVETDRLERLVGDVLDLAKLQAHRFTVRREEVDMSRVIEQAYGAFAEEARRREIDYSVEAGELAPVIVSDGDRVLQVISNLLSNAFRWTPDGGRIELTLEASNGSVEVEIVDSGPGIPAEHRERIFQAFISNDADGTGPRAPDRARACGRARRPDRARLEPGQWKSVPSRAAGRRRLDHLDPTILSGGSRSAVGAALLGARSVAVRSLDDCLCLTALRRKAGRIARGDRPAGGASGAAGSSVSSSGSAGAGSCSNARSSSASATRFSTSSSREAAVSAWASSSRPSRVSTPRQPEATSSTSSARSSTRALRSASSSLSIRSRRRIDWLKRPRISAICRATGRTSSRSAAAEGVARPEPGVAAPSSAGGRRERFDLRPRALERRIDVDWVRAPFGDCCNALSHALEGRFVHRRRGYSHRRMDTSLLDYELPTELIAQSPVEPRDASRLLVYRASDGAIEHRRFSELPDVLGGELAVVNDSRVVPGRMRLHRRSGGLVEVLLVERLDGDGLWEGLARPSRRLRAGERLGPVELIEPLGGGRWVLRLEGEPAGEAPLPPYIHEQLPDENRYQTVYAREAGSAAAPTAGLHFTPGLLRRLDHVTVTLHIGLDTFRPVTVGPARGSRASTASATASSAMRGLESRAPTVCSRSARRQCGCSRRSHVRGSCVAARRSS